jgi:hypothetical protein
MLLIMKGNKGVCLFGVVVVLNVFIEEPYTLVGVGRTSGKSVDVFEWIDWNRGTLKKGFFML